MSSYSVDYRVIHEQESLFKVRMDDAYTAFKSTNTPPEFSALLQEFIDLESLLYYEAHTDVFSDLNESDAVSFLEELQNNQEWALSIVQERMERYYIEQFAEDLYLFLQHQKWFFFENETRQFYCARHQNSPLQEIW